MRGRDTAMGKSLIEAFAQMVDQASEKGDSYNGVRMTYEAPDGTECRGGIFFVLGPNPIEFAVGDLLWDLHEGCAKAYGETILPGAEYAVLNGQVLPSAIDE